MTGEPIDTPELDESASFAELLEAHAGGTRNVRPGDRISAAIVAITDDSVFVATGSKVDGVIDRRELEEADGSLPYAVGDRVDLYVTAVNGQEIRLSKGLSGQGGAAVLEEARDSGVPVEGRVTGTCKGGYNVDVLRKRAFCPGSQIDLHQLEDAESVVGQTFQFLVTRVEQHGRNIVVSRRALLERERDAALATFLEGVKEGDVLEGTVTRLAPFGAFVEIAPGVDGMVHISELTWSRVAQADEAVSVGDRVRVKVLGIGEAPKGKGARISLSVKQAGGDPWETVGDRLEQDQVVPAKVVRLAPFGAFVEVLPGVEGLVHVSEMSWTRRVNKPEEIVAVGDAVNVKIKELDVAKRRISLSLRDAEGDPWADATERFAPGTQVTGTVEKRAQFGLFVNIAPGLTGLLPEGIIKSSGQGASLSKLNAGDSVTLTVRDISAETRRITLAPVGDAGHGGDDGSWKQFAPRKEKPQLGSLGAALQAAMQKRK